MAHFAKLDKNNNVLQVIVVNDEEVPTEDAAIQWLTQWSGGYSNWKQCSFNNNIRKQYPGIGYSYKGDTDTFEDERPETLAKLEAKGKVPFDMLAWVQPGMSDDDLNAINLKAKEGASTQLDTVTIPLKVSGEVAVPVQTKEAKAEV